MVIEMPVFESDEALLYFLRSSGPGWKAPLTVGCNACAQQFTVPVSDNGGVGHMEKLPGEAKDIAYHQNCNKYEYYFSGDRQLFEVLYNLNLHQYLNMTILILLLPGGGVPHRGGGGR